MPQRPVRSVLAPAMSASAEEPSKRALDLIGACMRITHHGGVIDFLPEPNRTEARLRIGFDVSRIERVPDDPFEELAADLVDNGIVLAGGGAMLRGISTVIAQATGLDVRLAEDPMTCVARGTSIYLEHLEEWKQTMDSDLDNL